MRPSPAAHLELLRLQLALLHGLRVQPADVLDQVALPLGLQLAVRALDQLGQVHLAAAGGGGKKKKKKKKRYYYSYYFLGRELPDQHTAPRD